MLRRFLPTSGLESLSSSMNWTLPGSTNSRLPSSPSSLLLLLPFSLSSLKSSLGFARPTCCCSLSLLWRERVSVWGKRDPHPASNFSLSLVRVLQGLLMTRGFGFPPLKPVLRWHWPRPLELPHGPGVPQKKGFEEGKPLTTRSPLISSNGSTRF